MKRLNIIFIILLTFSIFSTAQNSEGQMNDKNKIAIGVNIPEDINIGTSVKRLLESKMKQMVNLNGIGNEGDYTIFYLEPTIAVLNSNVTGGTIPMKAVELECTFELKDKITGNSYGGTSVTLKGVGKSDAKAYIQALKRINPRSTQIRGFIDRGKIKILEFYNSQCGTILSKAEAMVAGGDASNAYCLLLSIPKVSMECYYDCIDLAKKIGSENEIDVSACAGNVSLPEDETDKTGLKDTSITFQLNKEVTMNFVQYNIYGEKLVLEFNIINNDNEEFEFKLHHLSNAIRAFDNDGVEYSASKIIIGEESFTWNVSKTIIPSTPVKCKIEFDRPKTVKMIEFNMYNNVYKMREPIK